MVTIDCYEIKDALSLGVCELEDCMKTIRNLYNCGFISKDDYREICELADKEDDISRDEIQKYFNHVITTVYIYNCLQVLAQKNITPAECCKVNEIFRDFGIVDCDNIACLLNCASGESMGFTAVLEYYADDSDYLYEERGSGYLQVTGKDTQLACLQYIYDMYGIETEIDTTKDGYAEDLADYPWEATAWYWAVLLKVNTNPQKPLNDYVIERLGDNGGELTLGVVLTAECFVHGDNKAGNTCGEYTIDNALHVIARYDSLKMNDEEDNNGWYIDGNGKDYVLYIPEKMLETTENEDGNPVSEILEFNAPYNWDTFENGYNDLKEAGLIGFDLN